MRVGIAQLNPKVGDFDHNLEKALNALEAVKDQKPDLMVFSELYLMGYPPQDLLERQWFLDKQNQALARLAEASKSFPDIGLVMGAALPSLAPTGVPLHNSAAFIHDGRIQFSQAKSLLPTYDVFDEARYFDPAVSVAPYPFKGEVLGLSVCEDAWNDPELWGGRRRYNQDPIQTLAEHQATLMVNVSASPFFLGKEGVRHRLISDHARRHNLPFVFVNQVGGNDELIFDGQSLCVDADGGLIYQGPAFEEDAVVVDVGRKGDFKGFAALTPVNALHRALVLGLGDYLRKSGFDRVVVGLSGGIDSAVTFALAAEALGPANILGVSMPSMYTSSRSVTDAAALADNLGAKMINIPIKPMYEAYLQSLAPHFQGREMDVTEENIQARVRGDILMAISNKFGHIVLSTGNKSELAMGYCTLYGDMSGGLAVLSDTPKTMVYQLAERINQQGEIIPQSIIDRPPSAELKPDQTDQDTLPPYDTLDRILHMYVEEGRGREDVVAEGFDPELVHWVIATVNRNEYKRKQAPPGLKVTSKAFGVGRRMPIVASYG